MVNTEGLTMWWSRLDRFRARAEIVLDSEIARRQDLATVGTTMQLVAAVKEDGDTFTGTGTINFEVPRPADVESSAMRVRPLVLEQEDVFHGKVMKALGGLTQDAPQPVREEVKSLRKAWQAMPGAIRWGLATSKESADAAIQGAMRSDRQIARDFLYGRLLHDDADAAERVRTIPWDQGMLALVVWVADLVKLTEATKRMITDYEQAGVLTPRPHL